MRIYEELFIVRPDAAEEDIDAYVEQIKQVITGSGGTVEKVEKWGVKRLAYRVAKFNEGYYVLVVFHAGPTTVKEVERRMRVTDMVIKFLSVRIDEALKKLDKRKKHREKRARMKPPAPVAAVPATPVPAAPVPAAPMPGAPEAPAE
jgi:small subunit ribosomal protein S6